MAKTILLPETTFTGTDYGGGVFNYIIDNLLINAESITVVFDGVKYENIPVRKETEPSFEYFYYGADLDNVDFSTYPFGIISTKQEGLS